jgi:hypothetical protein
MVKKKEWSVLDVLGWIAFAIVVLYFFLKLLGVIHSPLTIDLIALISGAFFVGKYAMKLDYFFKDVENIKEDIKRLDEKCPVFKEERTRTK